MESNGIEKNKRRVEISNRMKAIEQERIALNEIIKQKAAEEFSKLQQLDVEYKQLDKELKS
ncbi:MAG: hypothetical protein WCW93_02125 [Candidatus Paceibacterota bacterium]